MGVFACVVALWLGLGASWAIAGDCADMNKPDQQVLDNGSCGYFVQPSQPSPSPGTTPTPWPVSVENVPTVKVRPEPGMDPLPVEIMNPPEPDPSSGWTSSDRETLQSMADNLQSMRITLVLVSGLVVLSLGVLVVFGVPRIR